MTLIEWRQQEKLTLTECASRFGLGSARTYQRYETGENRPSAVLAEKIEQATSGIVTVADLHRTRLAWERANGADAQVTS